jgi:hypothetical protein
MKNYPEKIPRHRAKSDKRRKEAPKKQYKRGKKQWLSN